MPRSDRPLGFSVAVVQSGFAPADYASEEAFAARVRDLMKRAVAPSPRPALVAFPELTGMWLPLLAGGMPHSLAGLAVHRLLRHPLRAARSLLAGRGLSFAFADHWRRTLAAWLDPFREAASRHGVYVCPGSAFLPGIERNATRDWEIRDRRVYNTACLLAPTGRLLCITRKANLTADETRLGIAAGPAAELSPAKTDLGVVGILVCLDGFQETLVSRLDGAGASLVIQPSANPVPWKAVMREGRWVAATPGQANRTADLTQERQWLSQGIGSLIQGRVNLRFSINPMSVSRILGHDDEGQSSVFRNLGGRRAPSRSAYPGLAAVASSWDREEILHVAL